MNAGKSFSTEISDQIPANSSDVPISIFSKPIASVQLPPSLFSSISSNLTDVGIFFTVYKTASLFPLVHSSRVVEASPLVIGVTVATGQKIKNLIHPVVFNFSIPITVGCLSIQWQNIELLFLLGTKQCVYQLYMCELGFPGFRYD